MQFLDLPQRVNQAKTQMSMKVAGWYHIALCLRFSLHGSGYDRYGREVQLHVTRLLYILILFVIDITV